jgi:hypothetical protein
VAPRLGTPRPTLITPRHRCDTAPWPASSGLATALARVPCRRQAAAAAAAVSFASGVVRVRGGAGARAHGGRYIFRCVHLCPARRRPCHGLLHGAAHLPGGEAKNGGRRGARRAGARTPLLAFRRPPSPTRARGATAGAREPRSCALHHA